MKERRKVTSEYKQLSTKDLQVDEMYQRSIDERRVKRIVKEYDPCLVNPIKVSFREGKYWIFDGRHTSVVEKTVRGKGRDVLVDCKVFYGLSRMDECDLFIEQTGASANVKAAEKLRVRYNFGDQDVIGMVNDAACAGVRVDFTAKQAMNKLTAYSTIMKLYLHFKQENARDRYIDMLSVLRSAWNSSKESFESEILKGMAKFYDVYYGSFKSKDLATSLSHIAPIQIVREGKALVSGSATDISYARIILRTYNTNRRTNRLEDRF